MTFPKHTFPGDGPAMMAHAIGPMGVGYASVMSTLRGVMYSLLGVM